MQATDTKQVKSIICTKTGVDEGMLAEIERHLSESTPGPIQRDCGSRLYAVVEGEAEECQIGEAFSAGDARLWRHAGTDIRYLLSEVRRLQALVQAG